MRAAVYSGTKNVYQNMLTAAKSLLIHSNVQKIYFLIEDECFPYQLPQGIECINVSNQQYFSKDGPNFDNVCTYMVLLRAVYTKIFPQLDQILSLDNDTIVNENISQLWQLDLTNYYLAGVEQVELSKKQGSYINMGVAMFNLNKIRNDHKDDELIQLLNTYYYRYKQQDCFNELFRGNILILPSDYNCAIQTAPPQHEKITHFAGIYQLNKFPHFNYYKNIQISQCPRNIPDKFDLDIIIPTYKNKKELRRTLNSIPENDLINIIVVDDGSELDYSDILNEYPKIQLYTLSKNSGPGVARQYGIEKGTGFYITFLDSGDYFYENGAENILKQISENTYYKRYSFSYVYDDCNILSDKFDNKTIGTVYKRSFIEMYNIKFSIQGSYANEDYGFSKACSLIIDYLEKKWYFHEMHKYIKIPVFYQHIDKYSLTKKNNNAFFYEQLPSGIITNGIHAIQIAKNNKIDISIWVEELNNIIAQEYYFFLSAYYKRQDLLDDIWIIIRKFYLEYYQAYEKILIPNLSIYFHQQVINKIKSFKKLSDKKIQINILQFIKELKTNEYTPIKYLTLQ